MPAVGLLREEILMAPVSLSSPVSVLYGIGPAAADHLANLEINTVYDLITFLPWRYNDWTTVGRVSLCEGGSEASLYLTVLTTPQVNIRSRMKPVSFMAGDDTGRIKLMFFNSPYLANKFTAGDRCFVHGELTYFAGTPQMVNPYIEKADKVSTSELVRPVYHLTAGITSRQLSRWIKTALDLCGNELKCCIPDEVMKRENFVPMQEAYRRVHFPETLDDASEARRQIAFEELILLGVGMKLYNRGTSVKEVAEQVVPESGSELAKDVSVRWKKIVEGLGFTLTGDQRKAIIDIQKDMMSTVPMNRLVQGDVGSGKTAVAILAMAMTALMGKQSVMLAPTSVLARQHYDNACRILKGSGINVVLLLGKTKASVKKEIKEKLKDGEASVIIGTHALLTDDIEFADLALVIADEQHRFGVKQREKLLIRKDLESGVNSVHNLVMTATPIPRTLAMVLYGDMKTSVIREKPAGRQAITTWFAASKDSTDTRDALISMLESGQQAYIVCARIDENEDELSDDSIIGNDGTDEKEITSVVQMKQKLDDMGITARFPAAVLYGSMNEQTKLDTMEKFLSGEIKILISTTVIEVGVDNPRANIMIIMDADRFGLSTLHQLRGRIGRGKEKSYCILVSESRSELALTRMRLMCESQDGFELAQKDLEIRGPGDFFGTRQHGIPTLRAANLYTDLGIASEACDAVNALLEKGGDEALTLEKNIEEMFELRFGSKMGVL
ncbi:MAG: ATP-dependent DNA helicase RecG [Ruminococcaceae bacterium]|nr:ATP-dependent DNA helicase RecG [Oscillospiraceae bacterium]